MTQPPAYLATVPADVLANKPAGVLARYLDARSWRPTLLQVEAERARRNGTQTPGTTRRRTIPQQED